MDQTPQGGLPPTMMDDYSFSHFPTPHHLDHHGDHHGDGDALAASELPLILDDMRTRLGYIEVAIRDHADVRAAQRQLDTQGGKILATASEIYQSLDVTNANLHALGDLKTGT